MANATLEPLSIAKTGQQHVEGSSDSKEIETIFLSTEQPSWVWCAGEGVGFHLQMCTHLDIHKAQGVILFPLSILKKSRIKAIEFYEQSLLYGKASGPGGSHCFLRAGFPLAYVSHG